MHPLAIEFLTAAETCALLRIGRANFFARVRDGRLPQPAFRIGRLPRWSRTQVLDAVGASSSAALPHARP
jgi:predicted DNA-binding transcriptional regulator AlpA